MFDLFQNQFQEIEFQQGISRSFVQTGCVPINPNDGLFVTYVPETQKGSFSFVPLGTRGEADVKSVLADETKEEGPLDYDAAEFADMILLHEEEDDDDDDDDENNELLDAAIDEG